MMTHDYHPCPLSRQRGCAPPGTCDTEPRDTRQGGSQSSLRHGRPGDSGQGRTNSAARANPPEGGSSLGHLQAGAHRPAAARGRGRDARSLPGARRAILCRAPLWPGRPRSGLDTAPTDAVIRSCPLPQPTTHTCPAETGRTDSGRTPPCRRCWPAEPAGIEVREDPGISGQPPACLTSVLQRTTGQLGWGSEVRLRRVSVSGSKPSPEPNELRASAAHPTRPPLHRGSCLLGPGLLRGRHTRSPRAGRRPWCTPPSSRGRALGLRGRHSPALLPQAPRRQAGAAGPEQVALSTGQSPSARARPPDLRLRGP